MNLVKSAWKVLVVIKDGLVLIAMLLFFAALFALLSARPNAAQVREGALVIAFDGRLAEQPDEPDPVARVSGAGSADHEVRLRDVVRALDASIKDDRVKAVVLDLDRFSGGYPAAVSEVAAAVGRVRASGKKVLAYATGYMDSAYAIAANASEIWVHPMGGALFAGPGGTRLYYKGLIDKLGVDAHIYKVGKFKSAVEPYARADMSPEAREANQALYGAILEEWRAGIAKARPKAKIDDYLTKPADIVAGAQGDVAKANLATGLVDRLGDRGEFGKRVAALVGKRDGDSEGNFRATRLADYVEANPESVAGDEIGVITIAGEIVDGNAGPGSAGGDTVSKLLLEGLAEHKLKALVVRVDSPGGSVLASERIRLAIMQAKAQKLPIVVSMGGLAASGGYWVSTPADVIFAERNTITGSIGIFGILPTFERALGKIGVTSDGVRTTPLSGQPDITGGVTPEMERILQAAIEQGYSRFIGHVAASRHLTRERVDEIGQGRVWTGATAQQIGLVDRFGTLNDAIAEAARRAGLETDKVHAVYLEAKPNPWVAFLSGLFGGGDDDEGGWMDASAGADLFGRIGEDRRAMTAQALGDMRRLAAGTGIQARCLECAGIAPAGVRREDRSLLQLLLARLGIAG